MGFCLLILGDLAPLKPNRIQLKLYSGEERIWNEATAIYADVVTHAGYIGKVEFKHCGRDMNKATHEIARECFSLFLLRYRFSPSFDSSRSLFMFLVPVWYCPLDPWKRTALIYLRVAQNTSRYMVHFGNFKSV
jgi:hypothetical protein